LCWLRLAFGGGRPGFCQVACGQVPHHVGRAHHHIRQVRRHCIGRARWRIDPIPQNCICQPPSRVRDGTIRWRQSTVLAQASTISIALSLTRLQGDGDGVRFRQSIVLGLVPVAGVQDGIWENQGQQASLQGAGIDLRLVLAAATRGTRQKHSFHIAPNVLERNFTALRPNQSWVTDITFQWTQQGWLSFAFILDLLSRRVVG